MTADTRESKTAAPTADPMADARGWIKEYLVPANTAILFAGFIVAALDFLAPSMRAFTQKLMIVAALMVVCLLAMSLLPMPERLKSLFGTTGRRRNIALWICFLGSILAGSGISLAHGDTGYLSSKVESIGALQGALLGVQAQIDRVAVDVRATKQDTAVLVAAAKTDEIARERAEKTLGQVQRQTNVVQAHTERAAADTEVIRKKLENPEKEAADKCSTMDCALAFGADRSVFDRLMKEGEMLSLRSLGAGMRMLMQRRAPNRLHILDLYLSTGVLPDINANVLGVIWSGDLADRAQRVGAPASLGTAACNLGQLRLLELAVLLKDTEAQQWLISKGANDHLDNSWCRTHPSAPELSKFSAASLMR
ncbi:hypothetical protein [Roseateles violae]|uniref:Uncharacterized protein n=1 Tax=Roseateles violae TaxID=3058042 RepID=A0ABT8DT00_9BURK|nr:hypothetical protein [Pelomonas sp. PFR6]MDN3920044.1 hypothetical protein [Pelomonas sp. PFR6]